MKFLNFIFITIFALSTNMGYAAKITDDTLTIGRPGSSANKDLKLGTKVIRSNESTGKLEFSNDGTLYKNLGSGSGSGSGGINVLANASFEDGLTPGWVNSGGTFTQETYSSGIESNTKFARFVASASGQYVETSLTAVPSFLGAGCQAQFEKYATITDGAWKIVVLDASSNVLATQNFNQSGGATTFIATPLLSFPCPVSPNTFKVRLESLAAATIDFDLGYGGGNKNTVDIAQARLAGESFFQSTASCTWVRSLSTIGQFTASATCPGPTIASSSVGQWQTTDTDLPRQIINNLPAGKYKATFIAQQSLSAAVFSAMSIGDGVTTCEPQGANNNGSSATTSVSCVFNYTSPGNRFFELYGATASGTMTVQNGNTAPPISVKFQLDYYPSDSQTAVTSDQASWVIDANIGGANALVTSAAVTSYQEIIDTGLDLVLNPGSAPAKIPCSTTNASTGLTCSAGSEGLGIVFTPPSAGMYKVCSYFSHFMSIGSASSQVTTYQLVETSPSSQTIIQEGKTRISTSLANGSGVLMSNIYPVSNCGIFTFTSVSEKTIRLMFENAITGTNVVAGSITADRASTQGQRDVRITVEPMLTDFNRPYSLDYSLFQSRAVTSPGVSKPVLVSAVIAAAGGTSQEYVDFINGSCTNSTSAVCTFNAGFWTAAPNCWTESNGGSNLMVNLSGNASTTSVTLVKQDLGSVPFNHVTTLFCHGPALVN